MTHARDSVVVITPPLLSPTRIASGRPAMIATPATPSPGTCWMMSTPINLYSLAFEAARMTVEADRQAWRRRFAVGRN